MLIVGVYFFKGRSTIIGSFYQGEKGVVLVTGIGCLGLLTKALQDAPLSDDLRIYTNYEDLVKVYAKPVKLPLPNERKEKYSFTDKQGQTQWRTRDVRYGNDAQWDLLRAMSRYWKWSMQYVEDLPACREWWELNYEFR